jgi:hypothetical protein
VHHKRASTPQPTRHLRLSIRSHLPQSRGADPSILTDDYDPYLDPGRKTPIQVPRPPPVASIAPACCLSACAVHERMLHATGAKAGPLACSDTSWAPSSCSRRTALLGSRAGTSTCVKSHPAVPPRVQVARNLLSCQMTIDITINVVACRTLHLCVSRSRLKTRMCGRGWRISSCGTPLCPRRRCRTRTSATGGRGGPRSVHLCPAEGGLRRDCGTCSCCHAALL